MSKINNIIEEYTSSDSSTPEIEYFADEEAKRLDLQAKENQIENERLNNEHERKHRDEYIKSMIKLCKISIYTFFIFMFFYYAGEYYKCI